MDETSQTIGFLNLHDSQFSAGVGGSGESLEKQVREEVQALQGGCIRLEGDVAHMLSTLAEDLLGTMRQTSSHTSLYTTSVRNEVRLVRTIRRAHDYYRTKHEEFAELLGVVELRLL
jgi:hypothetical protein